MPKGIYKRTNKHKEICRLNGQKQLGLSPINIKYQIGNIYKHIVLINRTPTGQHPVIWTGKCECGKEITFTNQRLASKDFPGHCGCLKTRPHNFKGYEDITGALWSRLKRGAKQRNYSFLLNIEDAWGLYLKQNKQCALTGLDISFVGESHNTASLDRIDNDRGYELSNVRWVHRDINKIRVNFTDDHLYYLCSLLLKHKEGK